MLKILRLSLMTSMISCSHITFQGVDVSDDGQLFVSGIETSLFSFAKAVVISCKQTDKNEKDYDCKKYRPADDVDTFANLRMSK